jgi:hypothetical protein
MNPRQLASVWSEWCRAAQALLSILNEQADALTRRDTERVEELLPLVEDRRETLEAVDSRARGASAALAARLGAAATLTGIAAKLPSADASVLAELSAQVTRLGSEVRQAMVRNHALIENELAYVAGTLTLIGQALRQPPTPYGKASTGALTLDRKV